MGKVEAPMSVRARNRQAWEAKHHAASSVSRRRIFGGLAAGGLVTAGVTVSVLRLAESQESEPVDIREDIYQSLLRDIESVISGDPEAQKVYDALNTYRKKGYVKDGEVHPAEDREGQEVFFTGIVTPENTPPDEYARLPFIELRYNGNSLQSMVLKDVPVDRIWRGSVGAHKARHVQGFFNGEELKMPGIVQGELNGLNLELNLLDRATNGNFRAALNDVASDFPASSVGDFNYATAFRQGEFEALSKPFENIGSYPQSNEELEMRAFHTRVFLNLTAISQQFTSPVEMHQAQLNYVGSPDVMG